MISQNLPLKAWLVSGVLFLALASGCARMNPALTLDQLAADPPPEEALVAGDVIDVKFFYTPQLNLHEMVQPDGTITLQLIGRVRAQGQTSEELQNDLVKLYASQLKQPDIKVIVQSRNDRKVYVGGEVKTPGIIKMPGELTLLEAIKEAGGFLRPSADLRNVLLVRQENGKHFGALVNVKKMLAGEEDKLVYLHPRDVIYVPPTGVTQVNDWVQQYVSKMLPQVPMGVGFTP
jgi:protein involved in polysaccharide export with SLBB domain